MMHFRFLMQWKPNPAAQSNPEELGVPAAQLQQQFCCTLHVSGCGPQQHPAAARLSHTHAAHLFPHLETLQHLCLRTGSDLG